MVMCLTKCNCRAPEKSGHSPMPVINRRNRILLLIAVELEKEKMIVLGQAVEGVDVSQLKAGMDVELVLEKLFEDEQSVKMTWKWKPVGASA